jgi:tetratricopeptide (TPR) repeat protein
MAGRPHQEATDLCDRVLARVEEPGLRASLAAATTMVHSMAGAVERCRELFDQAELDAARAGTDEAWLDVIPFAYMSVSGPADLDRREVLTDRLDAAATRLGRADGRWSAQHLRFSNQLQRGDPALRATAEELAALADEVRERQRDWECCYVRATVAFLDGRLEEAESAITDTLAYADTVAESRVLAVYGVQLLALRLVQNRLHELVDTIAGLAADQPTVGAWRAALALAAAQAGRADVAGEALDAALADGAALLAHDYAYTGALVALAEASALLGDADRAARVRPLLEPWSGRWSWVGTCTLGPIDTSLARLCALVGDRERAVGLADRALAAARRLDAPVFARLARASFPDRADATGGMGY